MAREYEEIVTTLREAFPKPVSDRFHDAYFVYSIMRTLDEVDALKSFSPQLGEPSVLDPETARQKRIEDDPQSLEMVASQLVSYLQGMFIWGHPRSQINVVPAPTIPSILGGLLPSIYNPNIVSEESSRGVAMAEIEATAMTCGLLGYDAQRSDGVFTFGGTGTLLYGAKIGLEKASPGSGCNGVCDSAVLICSDRAHYACSTVANWLGLGERNVEKVPTTPDNDIRTCLFETQLRQLLKENRRIACIVATMGTTDAFGLDDLQSLVEIRNQLVDEFALDYVPHIHADAVIGWAWSVFNDYDFEENPLGFRARTVRALAHTARRIRHLNLADSIGIDFHKTGFTPYVSSLFLVRNRRDWERIAREKESTPYLFQSGEHHPGRYTLETTRAGTGAMAALANLRLFGKNGLRALLGHLVSIAETLREHLEGHAATHVLNRGNFGPVTLFRVYPDGVDTFTMPEKEERDAAYCETLQKHNEYNRRIYQLVHDDALEGKGVVLSLTDCYRESDYGEPIVALKSYIMSPFSAEEYVDVVLDSIWKARDVLAADER